MWGLTPVLTSHLRSITYQCSLCQMVRHTGWTGTQWMRTQIGTLKNDRATDVKHASTNTGVLCAVFTQLCKIHLPGQHSLTSLYIIFVSRTCSRALSWVAWHIIAQLNMVEARSNAASV